MKFISKYDGLEYYTHDDAFYETFHESDHRGIHNRHDRSKYIIGEFELHDDIITEDALGTISKNITVSVYSNEGDRVPHMHFTSNDGKIDGCIKIENAEYFIHAQHKSKLTKKQAEEFHEFMKSESKLEEFDGFTNWNAARILWTGQQETNNNHELAKILEIPNYSNINHPEYYRYTIDGIGIYEYVRRKITPMAWDIFMKTERGKWLKMLDSKKYKNMKAWFKKEGYDMFNEYTYDLLRDMVPKNKRNAIKLETKKKPGNKIHYSDPYQILVS